MEDPRRYAPATARNRDAILAVLEDVLPGDGTVLEIASGSGEHAAYFAPSLATAGWSGNWQPTDIDPDALRSIDAHTQDADPDRAVILPAKTLDTCAAEWPLEAASAILCINMIHIAPWDACQGLMKGAARVLRAGGTLYLYGPYKRGGAHTAPSNADFDASLRSRDPRWGIRDLDAVTEQAAENGLNLDRVVEMPANNLSVVFRKGPASS